MTKQRSKYLIVIGILLFIGYAIYYQWHSSFLLASKGRYTIGTVEKIQSAGNGFRIYISFAINGVKENRDYIEDVALVKRVYVGRRLFIKYVPDEENKSFDFNIDCIVPDSIKYIPKEGWDQNYMKKTFSDCFK